MTTTARILQSHGLNANAGQAAARELGLTDDTERPAIGTTVGGTKFIGTEDYLSITVPSPAAIPILRRSNVSILCDTATAGADISLDIRAGAQVAGYRVMVFVTGTKQAVVQYGTGVVEYVTAGTALDLMWNGSSWVTITGSRKQIVEQSKYVTELFTLPKRKPATAWSPSTPLTYFPALCLTAIETYQDLSIANWPDLVPELLTIKTIFKDGLPGETSSPSVTNWAILTNVATLTFANNADTIAFLSALLEDEIQHGGYANWRTLTNSSAIGTITAGTYAITDVNASSRTVSFAFTAGNGSGAVSTTVDFFAFRIAGSTTTARVWTARGLSLMGANDANGYFVSGGLRRRGFFQGHAHNHNQLSGYAAGSNAAALNPGGGSAYSSTSPVSDGANNAPRTAKETHSPAITVHIYMHGGRYL